MNTLDPDVIGLNGRGSHPPAALRKERRESPSGALSAGEAFLGLLCLALWIVLFAAGSIIATEPARQALSSGQVMPVLTHLQLWLRVLSCYTITNVVMLCVLSSFLGTLGRRSRIGGHERVEHSLCATGQYMAAVIRGFFVYIALVSGLIVLTGISTFANANQETYIRLAGTASLFSFLAGYKPQLFSKLQERLDNIIENEPNEPPQTRETTVMEHATRAVVTTEERK